MSKSLTALLASSILLAGGASAQTILRIQTHQSPESTSGQLVKEFVNQVETMSDGSLDIEMYYSSAVVASAETFSAAINGVLDCDMTNPSYQTGVNPAYQFAADTMGGYDTPVEFLTWVSFGGGREAMNELYHASGMEFIGAYLGGQESMSSSKPLNGIEDLKGWKFRSPPGMETEIFAELGSAPVVMDFTEIFTALETGIIDGADASTLANNVGLGIYDVVKHTTYPGFHSMSSDHLACNKAVWDGLDPSQQTILTTAMDSLALKLMMRTTLENGEALTQLPELGVTFYDWSAEDRAAFREAAVSRWDIWGAKTPEAQAMVDSHKAFLARIGLGPQAD